MSAQPARPAGFERDFTTPEGARLRLRLASAGERAGAFTIDMVILIAVLLLLQFTFSIIFEGTSHKAAQVGFAIFTIFVFGLRNFYFIMFEMGRRAATPGKRLLGLRVAMRDGGPLNANAVLTRNLVREVEVFLPFYFVAYTIAGGLFREGSAVLLGLLGMVWTLGFTLFPLTNRDRLRLGDIIAGTWVVHAPKPVLAADIAASGAGATDPWAFTPQELSVYGIHELQVLEDILRNSPADIRRAVAARIRGKIGRVAAAGEDDIAFLGAYYAALRRHLEGALTLGRAKRHKNDRS